MRFLIITTFLLSLLFIRFPASAQWDNSVTAKLICRVTYFTGNEPIDNKSYVPLKNARFIVIDQTGNIAATGLSDSKGEWMVPLTIQRDPRFPTKNMGTITLITIANGFNEHMIFNVPVNEHGDYLGRAFVSLRPIETDRRNRNEPHFINAEYIHRLTIFETIDYYANQMGLRRQPQIDPDSIQWSPDVFR